VVLTSYWNRWYIMYPIITYQAIFSATYESNKSQTNGMVRLGVDWCGRLAQSVLLTQQPCHIQATEALQQRLVRDQGRAYDAPYSWPGARTGSMRTTGSIQGWRLPAYPGADLFGDT
jgi:hypothetical protein